ncbi:hypothetical protein C8J57DRAFT_1719778 [Mycena rebaudengoi]|nr:hypothetical protein C8J57DRAFT_1719778 [Mycena rebaudengoi]
MQQRIRELEAQIAQTSTSQAGNRPSIPDESINRPKNASKITMRAIRAELGYDKTRWNSFRVRALFVFIAIPVLSALSMKSYCRDAATSARLNWDGNWKLQRSEKLSMAYNAIEAAFPETRRFEGQWAIDRTVKQCWNNRKNYRNCVHNDKTYRGKEAAARRARHAVSPGTTPRTSPTPQRTPAAARSNGSPTPGPSRPPRARPINRRRISDSDDDEDEFVAASDPEAPRDEDAEDEGEEEDDGRMSKTAKGKRKASTQGGKNSKQARHE